MEGNMEDSFSSDDNILYQATNPEMALVGTKCHQCHQEPDVTISRYNNVEANANTRNA